MNETMFDDILDIRKGDENLTTGSMPSRIERVATVEEWEVKAKALREIFLQTLGEAPEISCPLSHELIDKVDCGDYTSSRCKTPQVDALLPGLN